MDKLTIFGTGESSEIQLKTEENNTIDTLVGELKDILWELKLTRKGQEEFVWDEEVEDSDVDLEDIDDNR